MAPTDPPEPPSEATEPKVDDAVAGLIDERPARPHLSLVPPPEGPPTDAPAPAPAPAGDDPLKDVLGGGSRGDEPEPVADGFAKSQEAEAQPQVLDLGKLLELPALSDGLRQLAGWIEKQIPSLNAAVSKFVSSLEVTLKTGEPMKFVVPAAVTVVPTPNLVVVPEGEPGAEPAADAATAQIDRAVAAADAMTSKVDEALAHTADAPDPDPLPMGDPPDPVPMADPPDPVPMADPDPAPTGDPEPDPDPPATD